MTLQLQSSTQPLSFSNSTLIEILLIHKVAYINVTDNNTQISKQRRCTEARNEKFGYFLDELINCQKIVKHLKGLKA